MVDTGFLRQKLLEYVSDGKSEDAAHMQDAEIGHRIYIAMKKVLRNIVANEECSLL